MFIRWFFWFNFLTTHHEYVQKPSQYVTNTNNVGGFAFPSHQAVYQLADKTQKCTEQGMTIAQTDELIPTGISVVLWDALDMNNFYFLFSFIFWLYRNFVFFFFFFSFRWWRGTWHCSHMTCHMMWCHLLDPSTTFYAYDITSCDMSCDCSVTCLFII